MAIIIHYKWQLYSDLGRLRFAAQSFLDKFANTASSPALTTETYTYAYDKLNRLLKGTMANKKGMEELSYDRMGNIDSLKRTGGNSALVDDLRFSYSGNRLSSVIDVVATVDVNYQLPGTTLYKYDANGNLTKRHNAGGGFGSNNIDSIFYNHLNLPRSVAAASGNITYVYDAFGRKLRSINAIPGQTRDYVDGIEYYNGSLELIHTEEGRIVKSGSSYGYEYILRDHLGNSRVGFRQDNINLPNFTADYYPFGLQYQTDKRQSSPNNQYLYNGKELQDGIKQYDYGARFYDPVIGRWGSVDPLAEKYNSWSPYNYVLNNPLKYIDPDGQDIIYVIRGTNGQDTRTLTYRKGNFYWNDTKEMFNGKGGNKTLDRLTTVYQTILVSNDTRLKDQLWILEKSDLKHYVEQSPNGENAVSPTGEIRAKGEGNGTQTEFDFSESKKEAFKRNTGVESSDLSTVAHEMQHQYDYDIGNMGDRQKPASAKSPQEIRAVYNENRARKIEKLPLRTVYGGQKIEEKLLRNPPNLR